MYVELIDEVYYLLGTNRLASSWVEICSGVCGIQIETKIFSQNKKFLFEPMVHVYLVQNKSDLVRPTFKNSLVCSLRSIHEKFGYVRISCFGMSGIHTLP